MMKLLVLPATAGAEAVAARMVSLSTDGMVEPFYLVHIAAGRSSASGPVPGSTGESAGRTYANSHRLFRLEDGHAEPVDLGGFGLALDRDRVLRGELTMVAAYPVLPGESFGTGFALDAKEFLTQMWQIVGDNETSGDMPLIIIPPEIGTIIPRELTHEATSRTRVIVVPEELSTPSGVNVMAKAFEQASLAPEVVTGHAAHSLLNLLGLWRSMSRSDVTGAGCPVDEIPRDRNLTLVRSFSRILDLGPVPAAIASRALRVGDSWPNPDPSNCDDLGTDPTGVQILKRLELSFWEVHKETLGLASPKLIPIPKRKNRGLKDSFRRLLDGVKGAFMQAPKRFKDAAKEAAANGLHNVYVTVLGHEPDFVIEGQTIGAASSSANQKSSDDALMALYNSFREVPDNEIAVGRAWKDLFNGSLSLIDAGKMPKGMDISELTRGQKRWVFTDARSVTPDPGAPPTLPRGAVSARVGDPSSWPAPRPFAAAQDISTIESEEPAELTPESVEAEQDSPAPDEAQTQASEEIAVSQVIEATEIPADKDSIIAAEHADPTSESASAIDQNQFSTSADAEAYEDWYQQSMRSLYWMLGRRMRADLDKAASAHEIVTEGWTDPMEEALREEEDGLARSMARVREDRAPKAVSSPDSMEEDLPAKKGWFRRRTKKPFAKARRKVRTFVALAILGGGAYAAWTYLKGGTRDNVLIALGVAAALVLFVSFVASRRASRGQRDRRELELDTELDKLRQLRRNIGGSMTFALALAVAAALLIPGVGWIIAPVILLLAVGGNLWAIWRYVIWRREESHKARVEAIEKANDNLRVAQTAASYERIQRRYREFIDWAEITGWLVHRPVRGAVDLEVDNQPTLDTSALPVSLQIRGADADRQIESLAEAGRSLVFGKSWVGGVYKTMAGRISSDLAERSADAPTDPVELEVYTANLFSPFDDVGPKGARANLLELLKEGTYNGVADTFGTKILDYVGDRPVQRVVRNTGNLEDVITDEQPVGPALASQTADSLLRIRIDGEVAGAAVLLGNTQVLTSLSSLQGRSEVVLEKRDGHRLNGSVTRQSQVTDLALVELSVDQEEEEISDEIAEVSLAENLELGEPLWSLMVPSERNAEPRLRWGALASIDGTSTRPRLDAGPSSFRVFQVRYSRPGVRGGTGVFNQEGKLAGIHVPSGTEDDLTASFRRPFIPAADIKAFLDGTEASAGITAKTTEAGNSRTVIDSAAATEPIRFLREIIDVGESEFLSGHWRRAELIGNQDRTRVDVAISIPSIDLLADEQALLLNQVSEYVDLDRPLRLTSHRIEMSGEVSFDSLVYCSDADREGDRRPASNDADESSDSFNF